MSSNEVVMVASENDALKGGKVGGVGDVVRDLPRALARLGWRVTVIIPSYGFLHTRNPATAVAKVRFPFAGGPSEGEMWEVTPKERVEGVTYLVFEHPGIRGNPIYCHDPPEHAFAQDASKYALFCSAVGRYLLSGSARPVLHLHDWHTGALFLLRELHPQFAGLKEFRTAFTIHNVAIQGTRPIRGPHATVEEWFPELFKATGWIERWKDPRYAEPTFTPMAAGITHAGKVNTVSPTYAAEILKPSDPATGFVGGEGLETILVRAKSQGRLKGILNGCEYPAEQKVPSMPLAALIDLVKSESDAWIEPVGGPSRAEVGERLNRLRKHDPQVILTSVTRVVDQKIRLLLEEGSQGESGLDGLLGLLSNHKGVYVLLGTGTAEYEDALVSAHRKNDRFLYLRGYSELIGEALYASGSLFIMPSLFEPCGISQMMAMRRGQPCVVHAVGGLKDTIIDGVNGFQFRGETLAAKVADFIRVTGEALKLRENSPQAWGRMTSEAARARFTWEKSAGEYAVLMYV
jgi:starch synthase